MLGVLATVLAALVVLGLPGLPTVLALRLRGPAVPAALVPTSLLLVTLAAEAGHLLALPWTILSPLVLGLVAGGALWPLRRRAAPAAEPDSAAPDAAAPAPAEGEPAPGPAQSIEAPRGHRIAILAGLVIGGCSVLAQALSVMGSVVAVTQTYDGVFHLNAVRRILRFGDGSAWVVGGMTSLPGQESYYPSLWHQLVSLVV